MLANKRMMNRADCLTKMATTDVDCPYYRVNRTLYCCPRCTRPYISSVRRTIVTGRRGKTGHGKEYLCKEYEEEDDEK